jgi:hypothetical protein
MSARALLVGWVIGLLLSCKAGVGDRCVCADDCKAGLICLAGGRVLREGECSPATGPGAEPGECIDEADAGDRGEIPEPEVWLDLGSKRDFEPGIPPVPTTTDATQGETTEGTTSPDPTTGTTAATTDTGTTAATTDTGTSTTGTGSGSDSSSGTDATSSSTGA